MADALGRFRRKASERPGVEAAYDALADEFAFLDEVLRARAEAGLTQAEVAARVGTTQSAIARLESATSGHSPSIATLQRYARALGCRLEVRLVRATTKADRRARGRRS
jgi:transcriptional regulator with XRE-family HTH domain